MWVFLLYQAAEKAVIWSVLVLLLTLHFLRWDFCACCNVIAEITHCAALLFIMYGSWIINPQKILENTLLGAILKSNNEKQCNPRLWPPLLGVTELECNNICTQLNKITGLVIIDISMQNSHILHLYLLQRHFKSSKTGLCGSVTPWSSCVTWWEPCWSVLLCCCATNMQVLLVIVCPQQWIKIVINNQDEADHAVFWPGGHNRTEVEVNLNATQRNVQCSLCSINLC